MKSIFILLLAGISFCCKAQINLYKSLEFSWDSIPVTKPEPVRADYKANSAVIHFEKQRIELDVRNTIWLTRHYSITFQNAEGLKNYGRFFVPGTNDPYSDYYYNGLDKLHKVGRPQFDEYQVLLCAARRITGPKSYEPVTLKPGMAEEQIHNEFTYQPSVGTVVSKGNSVIWEKPHGFEKPQSIFFEIADAQLNETYEIIYRVKMPMMVYLKSASSRVLFNGMIPKQNYELKIQYPYSDYFMSFVGMNLSAKADSAKAANKNETVTFTYREKNLAGLEYEKNCRPYQELPQVYLYMNARDNLKHDSKGKLLICPYDWSNVLYHSSFSIKNGNTFGAGTEFMSMDFVKPYSKFYTAPYEDVYIPKARLSHYITFTDKHNAAVTRLYKKLCDSIGESTDVSGYRRAVRMHHYLNQNLSWYSNKARARDEEVLYTLGELAEKNRLFENGRYRLYADLLYRTKANIYRNRMVDKRYEVISPGTYYPPNAFRDYFAVVDKGSGIASFMPKYHETGHFMDEYPFYFEAITPVITPYRLVDTSFILPPSFSKNRNSGFSNNIRTHTIQVEVDLAKQTCSFKGMVLLSGQFSTLTRSMYTHQLVSDSSINRAYYTRLTDGLIGVENKKSTVKSLDERYPFKCMVELQFDYAGFVKKTTEGYSLDFAGLLKHISESFPEAARQTDYYSDFLYHDIFRFTVTFTKNVTVTNLETAKKEPFVNPFGIYFTKLSQPNLNQVFVESNFKLLNERTASSHFNEVTDFYKHVNQASTLTLQIAEN